jgi:hypothetical protein
MSVGEENSHGLYQDDEEIGEDTIDQLAESRESAADVRLAGAELAPCPGTMRSVANRRHGSRSMCAGTAGRAEPVWSTYREFRTAVAVGDVTVTGVLPATVRPPVGAIAICGDVHRLTCTQALELVDALLLVVLRMDDVAEERYGASAGADRDRED